MKSFRKQCLAMASVVALSTLVMASAAGAVDKLKVQDGSGNDVFKVDDAGVVTGNGFKFDPTNPVAKKFGLGTTNPQSSLHLTENAANFDRGLTLGEHVDGAAAAIINIKKSRGTESAPTAVVNGDNIAAFHAQGYDGTSWQVPASILFFTDNTVTAGSVPAGVSFVTGTATTNRPERMRITSDGRLRLSNQPAAPANNATCTVGDIILDAPSGFLYLCTATNSWKRASFIAY